MDAAQAVECRALGQFSGCAHGLPGPSVVLAITRRSDWDEAAEARVGAAWPALPLPAAAATPELRFAALLLRMLLAADWPVAPVLRPFDTLHQGQRLRVTALPCLAGQASRMLSAAQVLARALVADPAADHGPAELQRALQELRQAAPRGKNTVHLLRAALQAGIPFSPLAGSCWLYGWGSRCHRMDSTFTSRTSAVGAMLARHKALAATVLRRAGLPMPRHLRVRSEAAALAAAHQLGWPLVTKPEASDGGRGVSTGITDEAALARGYAAARRYGAEVLVEQHIAGDDYRLTVFHGRVVWVTWRQPGGVEGDGRHDVATLLARLNEDPRRSTATQSAMKPMALDDEAMALLAEQGLQHSSVPEAGRFVRLRRAANVARGGTSVAANVGVHADNLELAVQAAAALELDIAGIDLLIPDIGRSWRDGGAAICEVNAQPQFGTSTQQHLHGTLLRALTPGDGRIPVVLVAGAQAQERAAELLQRQGAKAARVGLARADGAWMGSTPVGRIEGLYAAIEALLMDRRVDALLIAATDDGLSTTGLPVDRLDLLWIDGPVLGTDQAALRLVQVLAGRRRLVVDADAAECRALAGMAGLRAEALPREAALQLAATLLHETRQPAAEADGPLLSA